MRTGRRGRAAAILAAMLLAGIALGPAATTGAQPSPGGTDAECGTLDVLLLMDESASLRTTDPQNRRVEAADVLVRSLAASAEAAGGTVDLTIAAFGSGVSDVGSATLPAETTSAVDLVQSFTTRTEARNTDYVLALQAAADHFAARAGVPTTCKRLVWFTDGAYSIDDPAAPGIASYTSSTRSDEIEAEFEGQVCGALPPPSRLAEPLSARILSVGFVVQLVDFRDAAGESPAEQAERANTDRVVARLLGGDGTDPCRVPGERVEAGRAAVLADEFFTQGQIALGRLPVDCAALSAGYPSPLVEAASARGAPGTTVTILRDGTEVASGTGFASYTAPADAPTPGLVTAAAGDGRLTGCYADLSAVITPSGEATVVEGAPSGLVGVTVRGGAAADAAGGLGPDAVAVAALVDGAPAAVEWQAATGTWQVRLAGPIVAPPDVVVTASTPGWGDLATASISVALGDTPPLPEVVWEGPDTLEGAGSFPGRLVVVPTAATGGTVCVTFATPTIPTTGVALTLSTDQACGPDDDTFAVDAVLTVDGQRNAPVEVALEFTASYRPAGATDGQALPGTGEVAFPALTATKAADASTTALITVVLVVLSALLPVVLLLVLVNLNRRLPDPRGRRVATVALTARDGALSLAEPLDPDDASPLVGNRNHYDLPHGLEVTRRATLNPFAETSVEVTSAHGSVTAVPWMRIGRGRAIDVPASFGHLVLLRNDPGADHGVAVVVIPADAESIDTVRALDEALATTNRTSDRVNTLLATGQ